MTQTAPVPPQNLYAVAISEPDLPQAERTFIEFYWADDVDHAFEQALNAHLAVVEAVAVVPYAVTKPAE